MGANIEPLRPAQIVARRVVEARTSRGWSQAKLAEELERLGYVKSRTTLTKLEGGQYRGVSVDDVFALAAALGVPPVHLLTPLEDDAQVAIAPRVQLPAWLARKWIRGYQPVIPMLPDVDLRQIPESELVGLVRSSLRRGIDPISYGFVKDSIEAKAREIAAYLRNPQPEGENDGDRD